MHYSAESSMASSNKIIAAASFFLLVAFFGAATAKDVHVDWDDIAGFDAWAANTTVVEGDRLYFDYTENPDGTDVEQAEEEGFNDCVESEFNILIGDHGVELSEPGMYYFVNGFPGKCISGWKLQVNVLSKEEAAASPPLPPPPPTPTGPFFPVTPSAPFFPVAPDAPFVPRGPPSPDQMPPPCRSASAPSTLVSVSTLTFPLWFFIFSLHALGTC